MSWRNIKLIFLREVRDQLRDRRTLFMVAVLPLLLYPAMGIGSVYMMSLFHEQPRNVVVLGETDLPADPPLMMDAESLLIITDGPDEDVRQWLADGEKLLSDDGGGTLPEDVRGVLDRAGAQRAEFMRSLRDDPPESIFAYLDDVALLGASLTAEESAGLSPAAREWLASAGRMRIELTPDPHLVQLLNQARVISEDLKILTDLRGKLRGIKNSGDAAARGRVEQQMQTAKRRIGELFGHTPMQVLIVIPENFAENIEEMNRNIAERGTAEAVSLDYPRPLIVNNSADEKSMIAYDRVRDAFDRWEEKLLKRRLDMANLPESLPQPVKVEPIDLAQQEQISANLWSKLFPALLVIMAVTGAFYPAIDVAAGEKERGTMETLLICPAKRREIVLGKFLTVMSFSVSTALLNVLSMGFTGKHMMSVGNVGVLSRVDSLAFPPATALVWLVILLIPLAALFSALCLALATFARSTKEGQYYLTPLLMIVLGLTFFCLSPGVEITPFYSIMPVMGVALLLKALLLSTAPSATLIGYGIAVLLTSIGYSLVALWWAIDQFRSEDVLFREAERFELRSWFRHLMRDKESTPSFTEAGFCFVIIMLLQFAGMKAMQQSLFEAGEATRDAAMMRLLMVQQLAIIATPALMMGLVLTTSIVRTFRLRLPQPSMLAAAVLLPVALHPLSLELAASLQWFFPPLPPSVAETLHAMSSAQHPLWIVLLAFAVLPGLCEEIAFRGFILSGFQRSGRAWLAVVLSSLTFGLMHMIPQQVFNATLVGLVLGTIAVRSGSLLPCIAFHMLYNSLEVLRGRAGHLSVTGTWAEWFVRMDDGGIRYQPLTLILAGAAAAGLLYWVIGGSRRESPKFAGADSDAQAAENSGAAFVKKQSIGA